MAERFLYRKQSNRPVTAVQFNLEFDTFQYQKWGDTQQCKPGDWLVNNDSDVYSIDKEYFRKYYREVQPGTFEKTGEIWAEVAQEDGKIETLEGSTAYIAGDYLVYDREMGGRGYAVDKVTFEKMYEKISSKNHLSKKQQEYVDRIGKKIEVCRSGARHYKGFFSLFQTVSILTAGLIAFTAAIPKDQIDALKWVVAGLGLVSALSAGFLQAFKFQKNWIQCDTMCKQLESNIVQFENRVGNYRDTQTAFNLLVENCERILNANGCQPEGKNTTN